jgi:hypothetical protein
MYAHHRLIALLQDLILAYVLLELRLLPFVMNFDHALMRHILRCV